jgi:hypothetical protein
MHLLSHSEAEQVTEGQSVTYILAGCGECPESRKLLPAALKKFPLQEALLVQGQLLS